MDTCAICGKPIRTDEGKTTIDGAVYHSRCWDRQQSKEQRVSDARQSARQTKDEASRATETARTSREQARQRAGGKPSPPA